jgi:hypothetical protein
MNFIQTALAAVLRAAATRPQPPKSRHKNNATDATFMALGLTSAAHADTPFTLISNPLLHAA